MSPVKRKNSDFVIGLDCSTTSIKAIALDKNGKIAESANEPIRLLSPEPSYYEQDSNDWWISAQKVLKKISKKISADRIIALAISNQRETFVPLDKERKCLRNAIIWLDERCKDEVQLFAQKVGRSKIHRISGKPVDYAPVVYRLAWMKKHEPILFAKIDIICDVHSYIVWKLTDSFKTSWASADPFGLFDLKNKKWSPAILNVLELRENQFPETYPPGTILGKLSKSASISTGLNTDTLVIAGGGDGQAAGLGSNVLTSKRAYLNLGTAVVAGVYGNRYKTSKAFRTMNSCSESGYYFESSLRAGTFAIDWFVKKILDIDPLRIPGIYKELEKEAQRIPPGSSGLLHVPYLCGAMNPYWDLDAKGSFIGLSSFHARGHMYRAILEGIAFELLFAMNAIERETGTRVRDFAAIGGGSGSDLWCHILADITGKNICIPKTTEASGLGAAIAAAVGIGWYRTFREAANKMSGIRKTIKPDMQQHENYMKIFSVYRKIYPALKKINS